MVDLIYSDKVDVTKHLSSAILSVAEDKAEESRGIGGQQVFRLFVDSVLAEASELMLIQFGTRVVWGKESNQNGSLTLKTIVGGGMFRCTLDRHKIALISGSKFQQQHGGKVIWFGLADKYRLQFLAEIRLGPREAPKPYDYGIIKHRGKEKEMSPEVESIINTSLDSLKSSTPKLIGRDYD